MVQQFLAKAREGVGTPFHHQGRLPGAGLDCIGVIVAPARALGIVDHDDRTYRRGTHDRKRVERAFRAAGCFEVPIGEEQPGDILVFWYRKRGEWEHFAILTERETVIHASVNAGIVVEVPCSEKWRPYLVAVWRLPIDRWRKSY